MKPAGFALVRNAKHGWLYFSAPQRRFIARDAGTVRNVLNKVEKSAASGRHCVGYLTYEAAPAFDSAFSVKTSGRACAWFQEFAKRETLARLPAPSGVNSVSTPRAGLKKGEYCRRISAIQKLLKAGATYQVNLTFPLYFNFQGDPFDFFCQLHLNQASDFSAYIDTGETVICSASPELFFSRQGSSLECRPMKGTAERGLDSVSDSNIETQLHRSSKNLSENVMIVDMIRNDMGRVSMPGSVRVCSLFDIERYPTVFQATSTVRSVSKSSLADIFGALFPCASVTGAPKVETMKIIRDMEVAPRGIYTGALGFVSSDTARFNVPIRTLEIQKNGECVYGTGSGIVWESDADSEYSECIAKARVLRERMPVFDLLETLRYEPGHGISLLERHLRRMAASARYFGITFNELKTRRILEGTVKRLTKPSMLRLMLSSKGSCRTEVHGLEPQLLPWRVAISAQRAEPDNRFLYHKTTFRAFYEKVQQERRDLDDMIIVNKRGELTESCRANLVLVIGGRHYTPPVSCGLLPGTLREAMIESGELLERVLFIRDIGRSEEIYLINSVRGRIPIVLEPNTVNVS